MQIVLGVNIGVIIAPIFTRASAASGLVNPAGVLVRVAKLAQYLSPFTTVGDHTGKHRVGVVPKRILIVRLPAQIIPLRAEGLVIAGHLPRLQNKTK